MCEQLVARAAAPFRLAELWDLVGGMERYGVAGFGWGAAWLDGTGSAATHRSTGAFRDDPELDRIGSIETTSALVHLRRPSRLSTIQLPDAQPFRDPAGRFVLAHNGEFRGGASLRAAFRAQGRIHGRADTEVGQRWLEDAWRGDGEAPGRLAELHETLGGPANLALLLPSGRVIHRAGNAENPLFAYRVGRIGVVSTALYSLDRSLFRLVAPAAAGRRLVRPGSTVELDEDGIARSAAAPGARVPAPPAAR